MREERAEATIRQLYEGPYLRIADFATSGRQGSGWEWAEHSHQEIQVTIVSPESCVQAERLTDSGCKRASGFRDRPSALLLQINHTRWSGMNLADRS
jgi:hypothetical protein